METINSLETLEDFIKEARDIVVAVFKNPYELNDARLDSMIKEVESMYSNASFIQINDVLVDVYSKYGISSLPTVLFMNVDSFSRSVIEVPAKLRGMDITKENIITCILNYSSDLELK